MYIIDTSGPTKIFHLTQWRGHRHWEVVERSVENPFTEPSGSGSSGPDRVETVGSGDSTSVRQERVKGRGPGKTCEGERLFTRWHGRDPGCDSGGGGGTALVGKDGWRIQRRIYGPGVVPSRGDNGQRSVCR